MMTPVPVWVTAWFQSLLPGLFAHFAHFLWFHLYFACAQGPRDTPSARAAQLGPQTLVNLFNSPLYSDVIFMVQGGS